MSNVLRTEDIKSVLAEFRAAYDRAVVRLQALAGASPAAPTPAPPQVPTDLLVPCYTRGEANIREGLDGRRQFLITGPVFDPDGTPNGEFHGVYQAKAFSAEELTAYPEPPAGEFDRPYRFREPDWVPELNPAKCLWTFTAVAHVVTGVGVGLSRIAKLPGGGVRFWYAVTCFLHARADGAVIATGEGTSLACASFPEVPSLIEGRSFPVTVAHHLSLSPVAHESASRNPR